MTIYIYIYIYHNGRVCRAKGAVGRWKRAVSRRSAVRISIWYIWNDLNKNNKTNIMKVFRSWGGGHELWSSRRGSGAPRIKHSRVLLCVFSRGIDSHKHWVFNVLNADPPGGRVQSRERGRVGKERKKIQRFWVSVSPPKERWARLGCESPRLVHHPGRWVVSPGVLSFAHVYLVWCFP